MYLYNIHTHKLDASPDDGYSVKCILNTYPEDYYEKKAQYKGCWFSCGIHPWNTGSTSFDIGKLRDIVLEQDVVAIGEVGLDKLKGAGMDVQVEVFRKQIELAIEVDKPLIIHCVKAWDELISLYKEYKEFPIPWIIHGYRGNPSQARQLSKAGFKFSIGEKFNKEALKNIPLKDIFCETDMSDLTICKVYENISVEIGVYKNQFAIFVSANIKETFGRNSLTFSEE